MSLGYICPQNYKKFPISAKKHPVFFSLEFRVESVEAVLACRVESFSIQKKSFLRFTSSPIGFCRSLRSARLVRLHQGFARPTARKVKGQKRFIVLSQW